jgi:GNAT superfamily N-acetyltransferase
MKITIRPLTLSLWPDLEALFGRNGACNGCWCMYWRIGPEYHRRLREKNKTAFRRIVKQGLPPGLLAFDGELAVGWCQLTPRQDLRWLNRKPALEAIDDTPVWSISCFYVRRGYRRKGVMSALIVEALKAGKRANAPGFGSIPSRQCAAGQHVQRVHRHRFRIQAPWLQEHRSPPALPTNHAPRLEWHSSLMRQPGG